MGKFNLNIFDDLTISMKNSLFAKKQIELKKKIYDIEYSKSRLIISLKSLRITEDKLLIYVTGAEATCFSENFLVKFSKEYSTKTAHKQKVHWSRRTSTRNSGSVPNAI
jgi:hypothetical protein